MIKEQEDASDVGSIASDVSDEDTLMLHGPPWAKEGTLQVKEFYDSKGKKAKTRHWSQSFVVMDRGRLKTFDFLSKKKGNQNQHALGSGNWLDQATPVKNFSLNHSLTQMLPSGYNESRPHVFAVNLSAGGVVFFQAGTRDLVDEWVQTCNYWAARVSRASLLGGVSSVEYGWNRVLRAKSPTNETGPANEPTSILSMRIRDWTPPQPSETFATTSAEVQRHDLNQYCQTLQTDLQSHYDLKEGMLNQFVRDTSSKGAKPQLTVIKTPNRAKALANWERKHQYLLAECTKIMKYIEALDQAALVRARLQAIKYQSKSEEVFDQILSQPGIV